MYILNMVVFRIYSEFSEYSAYSKYVHKLIGECKYSDCQCNECGHTSKVKISVGNLHNISYN